MAAVFLTAFGMHGTLAFLFPTTIYAIVLLAFNKRFLSLGIAKGMTVTLYADGQDEDAALEGLASLVGSGFSEN